MNPAFKYIYHRFIDSPRRWHPFLAVYYLTYRCDFRCPYCSNGFDIPYHKLSQDILPAKKVSEIFARIRRKCDYIVVTGGEPLKHPEFGGIIRGIGSLGFKDVALNTNGYEVDRYLADIASAVHTLIFSIDTLDEEKADSLFGRGSGIFRRILSNIASAAAYPGRKYRIVISSTVTSDNIPDLYEVYRYARSNGFVFAACPELKGVRPSDALRENAAYREFFDFLIAEKLKGGAIHGSPLYLRRMRDFGKFSCRPFTMLVVDPVGQVFYPCLEIGHMAGNLLDDDNLHALRVGAMERFGPQPECGIQCHSACALGFSLILEHPFSMVQEGFLILKGRFCPNP